MGALPYLKPRFPNYADYARKTVTDIFSARELEGATLKKAYTFATSLVRNNGDGSFTLVPLPDEAQLAPVYGILAADFTQAGQAARDGMKPGGRDLLLAGNFDGFKPDRPSRLRPHCGATVPVFTMRARGGFFSPASATFSACALADLFIVAEQRPPLILKRRRPTA